MRHTTYLLLCLTVIFPLIAEGESKINLSGLMPKTETGVLTHLKNNPEEDGRNIKIAIIDTGVDLGHPALQKTSTGETKIIDWVDVTDGDLIDVKHEVTHEVGANLTGFSGRDLKLPDHLSGDLKLGIIHVNRHFPSMVRRRFSRLQNLKKNNKENQTDLQEQVSGIENDDKDAPTPPEVMDIVSFKKDGQRAVLIDTDMDGDLRDEVLLRNYRVAQEKARIEGRIGLTFAVNIYDKGKKVSLLYDTNGHGTHVAGIASAFYGPNNELNGVAPGAQIIAIRCAHPIDESGSNASILRGFHYAIEAGADVINLSFGSKLYVLNPTITQNISLDRILRQSEVAAFVSAGNKGPALSTVGTPGYSRVAFGIAASCSADTQNKGYAAYKSSDERLFGFSSRGPVLQGSMGVDFVAPGGAFSASPSYSASSSYLGQGTSMSSPHAAGCGALLRSAIKNRKWPYSLARLERAMINGARAVKGYDRTSVGHGMIDVPATLKAYEASLNHKTSGWRMTVNHLSGEGEGIYYRQATFKNKRTFLVRVRPDLSYDKSSLERSKYRCVLNFETDQPWLEAQGEISVSASGSRVAIHVDPSKLQPGLNVGTVRARRVITKNGKKSLAAGTEFIFPVTLIKPQELKPDELVTTRTMNSKGGERKDWFVLAPSAATHAKITFEEKALKDSRYLLGLRSVHNTSFETQNFRKPLSLSKGKQVSRLIKVEGGHTMHIAMHRSFSRSEISSVDVKVEFFGIKINLERNTAGTREALYSVKGTLGRHNFSFKGKIEKEDLITVPVSLKATLHPTQPKLYKDNYLYKTQYSYSALLPKGSWGTAMRRKLFSNFCDMGGYITVLDDQGRQLTSKTGKRAKFKISRRMKVTVKVDFMSLTKNFYENVKASGVFWRNKKGSLMLHTEPTSKNPMGKEFSNMMLMPGKTRFISMSLPAETKLNNQIGILVVSLTDGGKVVFEGQQRFTARPESQLSLAALEKKTLKQARQVIKDSFLRIDSDTSLAERQLGNQVKIKNTDILLLLESKLASGKSDESFAGKTVAEWLTGLKSGWSTLKIKERPLAERFKVCQAMFALQGEAENRVQQCKNIVKEIDDLGVKSILSTQLKYKLSLIDGNFKGQRKYLKALLKHNAHNKQWVLALATLEGRMGYADHAQSRLLKAWLSERLSSEQFHGAITQWAVQERVRLNTLRKVNRLQRSKHPEVLSTVLDNFDVSLLPFWSRLNRYDRAVKLKVLESLEGLSSAESIFCRRSFLSDSDNDIKFEAALEGARLGDDTCRATLIKNFFKFEEPIERLRLALDAICQDDSKKTKNFLVDMMSKENWKSEASARIKKLEQRK